MLEIDVSDHWLCMFLTFPLFLCFLVRASEGGYDKSSVKMVTIMYVQGGETKEYAT
jgi:hypothetical protein